MLIDHVNLNHIRIFECVYRTQSMTAAAAELHLTQSGVSQHIKSLEEMLDVKLFDRIRQKLIPTSQGQILFQKSSQSLLELEQVLTQLKNRDNQMLTGTISLGVPVEFGHNVILPFLAEFCRIHPMVKLKVKFDFASVMNEEILRGQMDFAFVDEFRMDRRIHTEKVYDEVLELCISEDLFKKKGAYRNHKKYFESLEYVDYLESEPILRMWLRHHLETQNLTLNVRATVMDVQAVARLVLEGTGAGVLPGHLVSKLQNEGHRLHRYKGRSEPLKNSISVAYLQDRTQSPAATAVFEFLKTSLTS